MHKVEPNQEVKILTVQIAVPAAAESGEIADEISALLSEHGIANEKSNILDWRYETDFDKAPTVVADNAPEEGDIFHR